MRRESVRPAVVPLSLVIGVVILKKCDSRVLLLLYDLGGRATREVMPAHQQRRAQEEGAPTSAPAARHPAANQEQISRRWAILSLSTSGALRNRNIKHIPTKLHLAVLTFVSFGSDLIPLSIAQLSVMCRRLFWILYSLTKLLLWLARLPSVEIEFF